MILKKQHKRLFQYLCISEVQTYSTLFLRKNKNSLWKNIKKNTLPNPHFHTKSDNLVSLTQVGLRSADQILEYNGVDLRQATAEQAAYELAKPAEKVSILVQYNPESKCFVIRYVSRISASITAV
jgi:hypothetical protein